MRLKLQILHQCLPIAAAAIMVALPSFAMTPEPCDLVLASLSSGANELPDHTRIMKHLIENKNAFTPAQIARFLQSPVPVNLLDSPSPFLNAIENRKYKEALAQALQVNANWEAIKSAVADIARGKGIQWGKRAHAQDATRFLYMPFPTKQIIEGKKAVIFKGRSGPIVVSEIGNRTLQIYELATGLKRTFSTLASLPDYMTFSHTVRLMELPSGELFLLAPYVDNFTIMNLTTGKVIFSEHLADLLKGTPFMGNFLPSSDSKFLLLEGEDLPRLQVFKNQEAPEKMLIVDFNPTQSQMITDLSGGDAGVFYLHNKYIYRYEHHWGGRIRVFEPIRGFRANFKLPSGVMAARPDSTHFYGDPAGDFFAAIEYEGRAFLSNLTKGEHWEISDIGLSPKAIKNGTFHKSPSGKVFFLAAKDGLHLFELTQRKHRKLESIYIPVSEFIDTKDGNTVLVAAYKDFPYVTKLGIFDTRTGITHEVDLPPKTYTYFLGSVAQENGSVQSVFNTPTEVKVIQIFGPAPKEEIP